MSDHRVLLEDPWTVDPAAFEACGTRNEKLLFLLNYAVLAPSILNTQPWHFRLTDEGVNVFADRSRLLPVTDPHGRELTISCGAALLNLRIAMRGFGFGCKTEIFPNGSSADLLARVKLTGPETPSDSDRRLRDAIPLRHTNRRELLDRPLPGGLLNDLSAAAQQEGATLEITVGGPAKASITELIAEAEKTLLADPKYRYEMGDWIGQRIRETIAPSQPDASIAGHTPTHPAHPDLRMPSAASATRIFSRGEEALGRLKKHLAGAPVIALVTTRDDTPESWIAAGQGVQRALLEATAAGACASFLNPPVEVPSLRPKLARAFGTRGTPQVLLRFGYGGEIPPEARRPTAAVLD